MAQRNPFMVSVMEKPQTNDSFQHELEDFIRKQRARGLHPRIYFRNMAEETFHQERDYVGPGAPMLGLPLSSRKHSRSSTSHERLTTVENLVPHCRRRLESLKHHQKNQPVTQDGKERTSHQEWGGATGVEQGTPKRKHRRERGSRREDGDLSRGKASAEAARTEKSKHRKRTRHDGRDPTRSRRQSPREKKGAEERDLWDEAILGSCY